MFSAIFKLSIFWPIDDRVLQWECASLRHRKSRSGRSDIEERLELLALDQVRRVPGAWWPTPQTDCLLVVFPTPPFWFIIVRIRGAQSMRRALGGSRLLQFRRPGGMSARRHFQLHPLPTLSCAVGLLPLSSELAPRRGDGLLVGAGLLSSSPDMIGAPARSARAIPSWGGESCWADRRGNVGRERKCCR
jgi:hypothetical protein